MRNVFKIVSSVGAAALLLSGAATAAPPQPFSAWSINSAGVITPAGATCTGPVAGVGFLQCQVKIGDKSYIQTIIAEGFAAPVPATGSALDRLSFRSQDFIEISLGASGGATQGVASLMAIKDSTSNPGTTFTTTAQILSGWATGNANRSEALLTLGVSAPGAANANEAFSSTFDVVAITNAANVNLIADLSLGQTVGLGVPPNSTGTGTDRQRFELRQEAANPAVTGYTLGGIAENPLGGVLNAALNSPLQGLWVGQTVTGSDSFAVQRLSSLSNASVVIGSTAKTTLGETATVDWGTGSVFAAQFSTAPTF